MIRYIVESGLFQLLFLGFYYLALRHRTFFSWNRAYLLGGLVLSLILPIIELPSLQTASVTGSPLQALIYLEGVELSGTEGDGTFLNGLIAIWALGGVLSLSWLLYRLWKIFFLYKTSEQGREKGIPVIWIKGEMQSFSFLKWIFLGDQLSDEAVPAVLEHEKTHVRLGHSFDILLVEFLRIPFWFNPMMIWFRKAMNEVHEYQADAVAVRRDRLNYYNGMLSQAFDIQGMSLVHTFFNHSLLKKRITMLQKKASPKVFKFYYLLALPVVGLMLWMSACQNEKKNSVQVPFTAIDEVPVYPGCEDAADSRACFVEQIQEHVRKNFNYPEEAMEKGIQGRVSAVFIIGEEGDIKEVNTKGPHVLLEEEVERIIRRLPRMKPGLQDGSPVEVPFSIPVVFKLD